MPTCRKFSLYPHRVDSKLWCVKVVDVVDMHCMAGINLAVDLPLSCIAHCGSPEVDIVEIDEDGGNCSRSCDG